MGICIIIAIGFPHVAFSGNCVEVMQHSGGQAVSISGQELGGLSLIFTHLKVIVLGQAMVQRVAQ